MRVVPSCFLLIFVLNFASFASGDIIYNEATDGDLGPPETATVLGIAGFSNSVTGILANETNFDPDAFMFTVEAGTQLDSFSFTSLSGSGNRFFAFNNAPVNTFSGPGNLIATLVDSSVVGVNLLNGTNNLFGSGVSGPLGPGNYYVWFQETDGANVSYSMSFATSVPEPSGVALGLAMTLVIFGVRRKLAK